MMAQVYPGDAYLKELTDIMDLAVSLSENHDSDLENIHRLGEGWTAEETLGIALYCSLRYENDFSAGVIAAVNHKGDSDSTGAVTGNILGALIGYEQIEQKWKENLELADVILEMADDICHGCQIGEYSENSDLDWERKYIYMRWKDAPEPETEKTIFEAVLGDITKDHLLQYILLETVFHVPMLYAARCERTGEVTGAVRKQPPQPPRTNDGRKLQFSPHKENRLSVLLKSVSFLAFSYLKLP